MVPSGLDGERQLLRTGLRQSAGCYFQERLVFGRQARERQLLYTLKVRICEHPSIIGTFKRLRGLEPSRSCSPRRRSRERADQHWGGEASGLFGFHGCRSMRQVCSWVPAT